MIISDKKCYVGIDVSKAILDVYVLPDQKHMQFKNESDGLSKLAQKIQVFHEPLIVMEATGGYEKPAAHALQQAGLKIAIVNPRQIRDFAKALGKLAKTDKIDAQTIANFAEKLQPAPSIVHDKNQQELADNNARRRQLIDMMTMEKNRLEKATVATKKSIERVLKTLEKELEKINERQAKAIQQNAPLAHKNQLLQSVKGIDEIVAASLLSDLPELGQVSNKQIAALAGLAPYNRDSGTLKGRRSVWGGRASVRCTLYMAVLVAMRYNAQIKHFYTRLCESGKPKKVAMTACMRKLLVMTNTMVKNNEPWRSDEVVVG